MQIKNTTHLATRANASTAILIARSFLASLFLVAGARKILDWNATLSYFAKLGVVMPEVILPIIVMLEIVGAIVLIAGWRLSWVATVLAVFTLASALVAHAFWRAEAPQYAAQLTQFLKNMAIAGGLLHVAAVAFAHKRGPAGPNS